MSLNFFRMIRWMETSSNTLSHCKSRYGLLNAEPGNHFPSSQAGSHCCFQLAVLKRKGRGQDSGLDLTKLLLASSIVVILTPEGLDSAARVLLISATVGTIPFYSTRVWGQHVIYCYKNIYTAYFKLAISYCGTSKNKLLQNLKANYVIKASHKHI